MSTTTVAVRGLCNVSYFADDALLARGATPVQTPTDRGGGFATAAVRDPFGNVIGLMHSPHFDAMHA